MLSIQKCRPYKRICNTDTRDKYEDGSTRQTRKYNDES